MNDAANSTIRGFFYQFNKTLDEIIDAASGATVIPEGLVEDIDVIIDGSRKAIQCKYLESKTGYKDSTFYQPLLEMLLSYCYYQNQGYGNIQYVLYVYYKNCKQSDIVIDAEYISKMILSKDSELIAKYICRLLNIEDAAISMIVEKQRRNKQEKEALVNYIKDNAARLSCKVEIDDFLCHLSVEVGLPYDELCSSNKRKMEELDMEVTEVEKFFYPNAINVIAEKSQQKDPSERSINKDIFWQKIRENKTVLVTKWTQQLIGKSDLFKHKRNQLSANIQIPTRNRYFIIQTSYGKGSELSSADLCNFLVNYLQFFKRKPTQTSIPMFFIECAEQDFINGIEKALFQRNVSVNNGQVGGDVQEAKLFGAENYNNNVKMALCRMTSDLKNMILKTPPDDLFVVGDRKIVFDGAINFNIEYLYIDTLRELEYLLHMQKEI